MPKDKPEATAAPQIELWSVDDVRPYERNAKLHPPEQVEQIKGAMRRFGFTQPAMVDEDGTLIAGHGRHLAATAIWDEGGALRLPDGRELPPRSFPVIVARGWTDEERRAYTIADNRLTEAGGWDEDLLRIEIGDLGLEADADLAHDMGFDADALTAMLAGIEPGGEGSDGGAGPKAAAPSIVDRFGAVPFSVLNAREGWWQDRKRQWLALGIRSEVGRGKTAATGGSAEPLARARAGEASPMKNGRRPAASFGQDLMRGEGKAGTRSTGGVLMAAPSSADPTFYQQKRAVEERLGHEITTADFLADHYVQPEGSTVAATGTSIFDPVLCELAYRWFCPPGGTILDPFAGGSVRGVVASRLGRSYVGVELRAEQVAANRNQGAEICDDPAPEWIEGDSREIGDLVPADLAADFLFSCPPDADLEVYSNDPRDISAMDYDEFLAAYREIIAGSVALLADNRFAAFVVGDVRGPGQGAYRNFVSETIRAFLDAGCHLYNEAILVTAAGSLPIRIGRQFSSSRKLGKTHQNVLIFVKGLARRAVEACGEVDVSDALADAEGDFLTDETGGLTLG